MSVNVRKLEALPAIIFNLWTFLQSGCKANQAYWCPIHNKEVLATEMFARGANMIFVQPKRLPFSPDIKAVSINIGNGPNRGRISVETTILDWQKLANQMKIQQHKYREFEIRGKVIFWKGAQFLITRTQHHFLKGVTSPRTLIQSLPALSEESVGQVMMFTEVIYGFDCFDEKHRPKFANQDDLASTAGEAGQEAISTLKQVLKQGYEQQMLTLLKFEQRPLMIQSMYQLARLIFHKEVLSLSGKQLQRRVARELAAPDSVLAVGKKP